MCILTLIHVHCQSPIAAFCFCFFWKGVPTYRKIENSLAWTISWVGLKSKTTSVWLLIGCQALGAQFVQTFTEGETEEEGITSSSTARISWSVEGCRELPRPPSEMWGGTAAAVLPVVLVALGQVSLADVPVYNLVHCNTKEKVENEPFVTRENGSEM